MDIARRRSLGAWIVALASALACTGASCSSVKLPDVVDGDGNGSGNGGGGGAKKSDRVDAGIVTDEMIEADPYGFRVQWIAWDSHFRGTELRIGDRIIGVNGERYRREGRRETAPLAIGGHQESTFWERAGAGDGTAITLTVWRRGETFEVEGELRAERFYHTDDDRRALGPGGPYRLASDGFRDPWAAWYEDQIKFAIRVLDGGWQSGSFHSRRLLGDHRGEKERVDYLVEHYPGPFAEAVARDWKRVHDVLLGPERTITREDLEYRTLGDKRAARVEKIAGAARRKFLEELDDEVIEPFPAVDPIEGDLESVAGKIVALPEIGPRDWITEGGHGYLVAGDRRRGYYFADSRAPAMKRVLFARHRYTELVSPKIGEEVALIGRIRPEPTMRVVGGRAVTGLAVDVLAATVGGAMFVDAQVAKNGESPFAGQSQLGDLGADVAVGPEASPRRVMEAEIAAVKVGDREAWAELYAPWRVIRFGPERIRFDPYYYRGAPKRRWVDARRLVLDEVYDVNVVDVGLVRQVMTGEEFEGAPAIDEVEVEVEHIGKFPEGHRPFTNASVTRVWTLQRRDGGPWRITTRKAI